MPETKSAFEQVAELTESQGVEAALDFLANDMRENGKFYELFEILKMQIRQRLDLPLTHDDSTDGMPEDKQRALEDALFDACRDVGTLLMKDGRPAEGWTFLRPVGDQGHARDLLKQIEVTDENVDGIIEVALQEQVAPAYGFSLLLERYGTCNSITTYDAELSRCSMSDKQEAAGILVEHLHAELTENVRADIERREEKQAPAGQSLLELVKDRPQLFEANAYHIDTTHLSSVVRIARVIEEPKQLELAIDLTEYGLRLNEQYHYEGDSPFNDAYPSTRLYLNALLGREVDEAIAYFEEKARTEDTSYYGPIAAETLVDFLRRTGRCEQAIEKSIEFLPDGPRAGIAPPAFELCKLANSYDRMMEFCKERGDLLGYSMCVLHKSE